jgi:predicted nucleic acid-binding protein
MIVNPDLRYFIDTNLLVYAFDRTAEQKRDQAAKLLESIWENENGYLSIQVLQEFFVTVTRKIATPINLSDARQIVADLAHWRVHAPSVTDLLQAIDMQQDLQLSYWDAQIVQSAISSGCTILLTEDLNHGQVYGVVQVINPFMDNQ